MVFSGAALPAAHCCLKVGPLGPAGGAAEGAELGCGAPGATYGSTAGLDVLDHVSMSHHILEQVGTARGALGNDPRILGDPYARGEGRPGVLT